MWKFVSASVQGSRHRDAGEPCQDTSCVECVARDDQKALIIVCSDGAGSAKFAERGSEIACKGVVRAFCEHWQSDEGAAIDRDAAMQWLSTARSEIDVEAQSRGTSTREFACTLIMAVLWDSASLFLQIGDGAIVVNLGNEYVPIFWPQSGEYINTTNFLTDDAFADRVQFQLLQTPTDEISVFTDGLERLALNYALQTAHGPFFDPMFKTLRSTGDSGGLVPALIEFLDSPRVIERTDDDKTLVLATRRGTGDVTTAAI